MTDPVLEDLLQRVRDLLASAPTNVPPASSTALGAVKLRGALGGTAESPTVPALASKADLGPDGKVPASQLPTGSGAGGASSVEDLVDMTEAGRFVATAVDNKAIRSYIGALSAGAHTDAVWIEGTDPKQYGISPATLAAVLAAHPLESHTHVIADVTGLQGELDGKLPTRVQVDGYDYPRLVKNILEEAQAAYDRSSAQLFAGRGEPHVGFEDDAGYWIDERPPRPSGGDIYLNVETLALYRYQEDPT